jgi:SMC interacting uncharacterized protein involved in chromosome segregation
VTTDQAITLLGVLLSAGLARWAGGQVKAWTVRRRQRLQDTVEKRHMSEIDGSLLTVVRARDELEDDNRRLREQLVEERRMRVEDQLRHEQERGALRAEIDRLETKLRELLLEVQHLKERSG